MILKNAISLLNPGGILIFREVNPDGGPIAEWNRFYEKVATSLGFTQAGFIDVQSKRCSSIFFADVLFIGKKKKI